MTAVVLPVLALILLSTSALRAESMAEAVDGDTLLVNGETVRLLGIDAPDKAARCRKNGDSYPCGLAAQQALAALIADAPVRCDGLEGVRFGKVIVATCRAGDIDLGHEMVRRGWARADRRYASRYEHVEAAARAAKLGIWATADRP